MLLIDTFLLDNGQTVDNNNENFIQHSVNEVKNQKKETTKISTVSLFSSKYLKNNGKLRSHQQQKMRSDQIINFEFIYSISAKRHVIYFIFLRTIATNEVNI